MLDECKKDVKASIEEVKREDGKRNKWWESLTAKQEIANAMIQETQVAMSECLEILVTAHGQLEPVDDDNEEVNDLEDVLRFLAEYVTKVVTSSNASLPKIIEGVQDRTATRVYSIYQEHGTRKIRAK